MEASYTRTKVPNSFSRRLSTTSVHDAMSDAFLNKVTVIAINMLEHVSPVSTIKEDGKQVYFMAKTQVLTKNDWVTI